MSYYDDSSLFVAPNGYKASVLFAQKPMDANGQLAFTRSNDTATRVASNGLIEKVRTNLLLQSNGFDTASWSKSSAGTGLAPVVTANAGTAPDGTNNAFRVQFNCVGTTSVDRSRITQNITSALSTPHASSVYIKAFSAGEVGKQVRFITEQSGSQIIITLTADWQRVVNVGTSTATSLNFLLETRGSVTANTTADVLLAFAQFETGDIATQYIPTVAATVSVGPLANIPRIDYLGGGCGKLLLEPQRTNLITFSEQFDNAAWIKFRATISANVATSPDGYTNADKLIDNATLGTHGAERTINITGVHTFSVFAKASESSVIALQVQQSSVTSNYALIYYDLISGQLESGDFSTSLSNGTIQEIGNGWYRCTITYTPITAGNHSVRFFLAKNIGGNKVEYVGNGTDGVFLYGAQLEAGSYASSYVNTLAASVTRGADACSKTGISSLIGQTEGTVFVDFVWRGRPATLSDNAIFSIGAQEYGTSNIAISNYNAALYARVTNGVSIDASITFGTMTAGTRYKAAIAYANNDVVFYVNGVNIGNDTSVSIPAVSNVNFQNSFPNAKDINQALLFKTRLSNADLAALTA